MIKGLKIIINVDKNPDLDILSDLFDSSIKNMPDIEYKSFFYFYGSELEQYYIDKKRIQELLVTTNKSKDDEILLGTLTNRLKNAKNKFDEHEENVSKKEDIKNVIDNKISEIKNRFNDSYFDKIYRLYLHISDSIFDIPKTEFPNVIKEYFDIEIDNSIPKTVYSGNNINRIFCDLLYQTFKQDKLYDFLLVDYDELNNDMVYNNKTINLSDYKKIKVNNNYIIDINCYNS